MTRASARRLWHYAIIESEKHTVTAEDVKWQGDMGWSKSTSRADARAMTWPSAPRARCASTMASARMGLHGEWKTLVGQEDEDQSHD